MEAKKEYCVAGVLRGGSFMATEWMEDQVRVRTLGTGMMAAYTIYARWVDERTGQYEIEVQGTCIP